MNKCFNIVSNESKPDVPLQVNIRAMGLLHRTSDRVAQQRTQIKELESRDIDREEKLLNIERKFGDVKASSEDLIAELHKAIQTSKEGSDMMKVIVDRYDEAQAKIRTLEAEKATLEADKSSLVIQIKDAFEKATLKARYDLLKEYKRGLLVDAEVDEEIELYEEGPDEAGCSSAAPAEDDMPASSEQEHTEAEPPVEAAPEEGHEMPK
jgi:chromosome segregation ATPase